MTMNTARLTAALLLAAAATACPGAAWADSLGCLIGPSQTADIGSPVVGVLQRVNVDRGDAVRKGQVVAVLRADVERAQVVLAQSRAEADGEVQAAQRALDFAQTKRDRVEGLFAQDFVSRQAVDQAAAEAQVAQARLAQAREQSRHSGKELGLASAQLAQRVIRSPIDGVVMERYLGEGERVDERPIMKIAAVNPLRVEVVLPASLYGQLRAGDRMQIKPDLAALPGTQATAAIVDRIIDPASNTFRARLELVNDDGGMPAGVRCKATLVSAARADPSSAAVPSTKTVPVARSPGVR